MPTRWNTLRVALWTALAFVLYVILEDGIEISSSPLAVIAALFGQAVGSGVFGAVLGASVSGLRNLMVVRKQAQPD